MALRHDAMAVAARIIREVRVVATDLGPPQVGTVGMVDVTPNLVNVVSSKVVFTVDLRNTDEERLEDAERRVFTASRAFADEDGCEMSIRTLARFEPVEFDDAMIDLVEATAHRLGHSTRRMPSGAGHDAQMLARVCPTSMVFVPSVNGLSHNIAEYTTPDDVDAGANVLLQVVLERAMR
jgi:N-carbamoyl-L-amino-acid hydrolase